MNTIRGRILVAFLVLFTLTSFLFYVFQSLRKIDTSRSLTEKVAVFNVNQLKAFSAFAKVRDLIKITTLCTSTKKRLIPKFSLKKLRYVKLLSKILEVLSLKTKN